MGEKKIQPWELAQKQSLSLRAKVAASELRIRQWHDHYEGDVYVAFSGGKDSTVLLDLVRSIYPKVPAVFCDTGLEYPEIRDFVKTVENVVWLRPKMTFSAVIENHGYPVVSKEQSQFLNDYRRPGASDVRKGILINGNKWGRGKIADKWQFLLNAPFLCSDRCCHVMKKDPSKRYEKETGRKPFLGLMACESQLRMKKYEKEGCNAFSNNRPTSCPLSFWLEDDIWAYIKERNLTYSKIYDMGYERTGCMFCMFGVHMEKGENRFQRMARTHPKQYEYCMEQLGLREVLKAIGVPSEPEEMLFDLELDQRKDGE